MSQRCRLLFCLISLFTLIIIGWGIKGDFSFIFKDVWFSSGLLLTILLSLIDQPHFSKDSNVFTNAVTAFLALFLVETHDYIFKVLVGVIAYLMLSSFFLMWKRTKSLNDEGRIVQFITRFNRIIGQPLVLFSAIFLWNAINAFSTDSPKFGMLFIFWMVFVVIGSSELSSVFNSLFSKKNEENEIGEIFGVQSKNVLLVKLNETAKKPSNLFDFVAFKRTIDHKVKTGLIVDVYILNKEQWAKVLSTSDMPQIEKNEDVCKKMDYVYQVKIGENSDYKKKFVGIVTDHSTIDRIKFIYNSKIEIKEGDLLELKINHRKILYQIVQGQTQVKTLELKNEIGFIIGEAIQLGEWNSEKGCFEIFGWVPSINTPIFIASNIDSIEISEKEIEIGHIPSTNYSIVIDKELAVTHHTAILGVTGTGKSVFSRNLIKQIACETTKVIVVDLTGEYCKKISGIKQIISSSTSNSIFPKIEIISAQMAEFRNRRDMGLISSNEEDIKQLFEQEILSFINGSDNIGLFDIPEISNSFGNIEYTKYFFSSLFNMAKNDLLGRKRVCVVLEEAHTVVPETSMLAISDNASRASVNAIAQIALQGRKYNIGFIVIAQRTANVSKTILTQCNSLVVFKELDNTSCDFLSNYMSQDHVRMLSSLKSRQAIAVGKAFRSSSPLIFEVPELDT